MCRDCDLDAVDLPPLPPVLLPSAAELLAAAERSAAVADLRRYVAELDGESAPGRTLLPRWAEACGLVRVLKGTHVPVKKNAKLLNRPLELWARAFESLDKAGYGIAVEDEAVPFEFGMLFPDFLAGLQTTLYNAAGTPVPLELLYGLAEAMPALLPEPEVKRASQWRHGVRVTLDVLERLGAVERVESDPAELAKLAELTGKRRPDPTLVSFTPIALWAMNRMLRDAKVAAPVVGEMAGETLDKLCAHVATASPEVADAELRAWVTHRSPAAASDQAADFLRRTESPAGRMFALQALGATGELGVEAARAIRAEGGVPGAVTAAWLVERGVTDAGTLTAEEVTTGMTDHLAAMEELGLLLVELDGLPDQATIVRTIATADHPHRLRLLDVIAQEHPDRKIAKQARKARFTLRTGGN
jgi:hypothetical protein